MNISNKIPQIVVGVLLLALVYLGYQTFFAEDPFDDSVPPQIAEGQELLVMLSDMRQINLRGDIFADPVFRSLQNFSLMVREEPIGRNNPFMPIDEEEEYDGQAFIFEDSSSGAFGPSESDTMGDAPSEDGANNEGNDQGEQDTGDDLESGGEDDQDIVDDTDDEGAVSLPSAPATPGT